STPASHVFCTANTPQAPASAFSRDAASSRSPRTTSAPLPASVRAASPSGLRVMARTLWPPASSARATAPPWCPVAPVTRMVPVFMMSSSSSAPPSLSAHLLPRLSGLLLAAAGIGVVRRRPIVLGEEVPAPIALELPPDAVNVVGVVLRVVVLDHE